MRRGIRYCLGLIVLALVFAVPVALSSADRTTSTVKAKMGQAVTLDGEQVHTVIQAKRWAGDKYWHPKAGQTAIAVQVRIKALKKTSYNALYYAIKDLRTDKKYGKTYLGEKEPALSSSNKLRPPKVVTGWVTIIVPTKKLDKLQFMYYMHSGFGSTLIVPLTKIG